MSAISFRKRGLCLRGSSFFFQGYEMDNESILFIYFFRVGLIMGIAELHIKKEMILDFNKILFPQLSWLFPYVFERFGF
jgi:hypothetical protein